MAGITERTLNTLELLARNAGGLELGAIATELQMPRSATHRLLSELVRCGYVRQLRDHGAYMLSTRMVGLGLTFLSQSGMIDFAQPLLDRLAEASGELARLSIVDGDRLTWVARAQGARSGLRYDPDSGSDVRLSCSASGIAWLSTLDDDRAIALLSRQGIGSRKDYGPEAPTSVKASMAKVTEARAVGASLMLETFAPGLAAMAAPVLPSGKETIGVVSIAGPSARLTAQRMKILIPLLISVAAELAAASSASHYFRKS